MSKGDKKQPAWGYRLQAGEVVAKLFQEGLPARGWADSPAKLKKSDGDD